MDSGKVIEWEEEEEEEEEELFWTRMALMGTSFDVPSTEFICRM